MLYDAFSVHAKPTSKNEAPRMMQMWRKIVERAYHILKNNPIPRQKRCEQKGCRYAMLMSYANEAMWMQWRRLEKTRGSLLVVLAGVSDVRPFESNCMHSHSQITGVLLNTCKS
jgi:hypothetical protein